MAIRTDSNLESLLESSHLSDKQKDDLRAIYPVLREAQQEVVKMHGSTALQVLTEKALHVFRSHMQKEEADFNAPDLAHRLDRFLQTIGLKHVQPPIIPSRLEKARKDYPHYFRLDNMPGLDPDTEAMAASLIDMCHNVGSLYSYDQEEAFTRMRERITREANAYENRIHEFIETHQHLPEAAEAKRYVKKVWLWRDGVIEGDFPLPPAIDGFPLPTKGLSRLETHPLLNRIHDISDKLRSYALGYELNIEVEPLRILEAGQKSLGRIIEKAEAKNALPSELHDLARAMLITRDIHDIARFDALFYEQLKLNPHCQQDNIDQEGWFLSKSGYCDSKTTSTLCIDGNTIGIESQIKLPEQRKAEMKSHRIFEFTRTWLKSANENADLLTNPDIFKEMLSDYNELISILKPLDDKFAGSLVRQYLMASHNNICELDKRDENTAITSLIKTCQPLDKEAIHGRYEDKETILQVMDTALADLHAIYHIAAAKKTGGASAALYNALYQRDIIETGLGDGREYLTSLLPELDTSSTLPHTVYDTKRGVYTEADMDMVREKLHIVATPAAQKWIAAR